MVKKGATYACIPCGLSVRVTDCGISSSRLMCCGKVMEFKKKTSAKKKKSRK